MELCERAIIGFDHGLLCHVKNMALGPTESLGPWFSHGMGDRDQILHPTTNPSKTDEVCIVYVCSA